MNIEAPRQEALTDGALALVGRLHEELDPRRRELLDARQELQQRLDAGESLDFVTAPEDFRVAPVPAALQDRRVEITGPTSRNMVINALNSGARGFMADFEDSNSPTWTNVVEGQVNLTDAIDGSIEHDENGKHYELGDDPAVLHVRPRGLHLPEAHVRLDGAPVAGAFMDFGLYVHRNAETLLERGWGPYFYIPKLESQREAALWRDAFVIAEETHGLERGTIKAKLLIETHPAAICMDAILYELRDHVAGLNAGRWDYIFSMI
jgi:malate synthase